METKHLRLLLLVFGLVVLGATLILMMRQTINREVPSVETPTQNTISEPFALTSRAFASEGEIPTLYTCKGKNISPPLEIQNAPANAKSFAVIMHDPDAPDKDWVHWIMWNIPTTATTIKEKSIPNGAIQGMNDFNKSSYGGPCPPADSGVHHYIFEVFALNESLNLGTDTRRSELIAAMNGKIIQKAQLIGTVEGKKTNTSD